MARSLIRPASSCRPGQRRATGHGLKLIFFGRAGQRRYRRGTALDNGGDLVEVAGAHLLLMRDEGVAFRPGGEFRLLHFLNLVAHPLTLSVGMGEVEHVEPHAVDPREGNKLVFVSHVRQLLLEAGDGFIIEIFLPVKRR